MCPEVLIQQPVEFPAAVTRKSLTDWTHLMDHWQAESVVYQNGIRDFQSFSQSETGPSLFCIVFILCKAYIIFY
jgi:hypothetical protein